MIAYTRAQFVRLLKIDFVRFCIVGGTGFIINFVILAVLHKSLHVPIFISQFLGAEIALFSNFMLHHHWTYKSHKVDKSFSKLILQFHSTTWPAIVGSAIMVSLGEKLLHLGNLDALILSSVIALAWNFFWSKFVVWRDMSSTTVKEIIQ